MRRKFKETQTNCHVSLICGFYLLLKVLLVFLCSLLLFLHLFPGYTRLLVAMLAADVAERAFLPIPWQPPQFQVRVGRWASWTDRQTEWNGVPEHWVESWGALTAAWRSGAWVHWGPEWDPGRVPAGGWCDRSWRSWPASSSPSHTTAQTSGPKSADRVRTGNAERASNLVPPPHTHKRKAGAVMLFWVELEQLFK